MTNTDTTVAELTTTEHKRIWRRALIGSSLDTHEVNALLSSDPSVDEITYMLSSGLFRAGAKS